MVKRKSSDAGAYRPATDNTNSHKILRELGLLDLKRYAKRWVEQYPDVIRRIALYEYSPPHLVALESITGREFHAKYAIIFEESDEEELFKAFVEHHQLTYEDFSLCEIKKIMAVETRKELKFATGRYQTLADERRRANRALMGTRFFSVYQEKPGNNFQDEWFFATKKPHERLPIGAKGDEPYIILHDSKAHDPIKHSDIGGQKSQSSAVLIPCKPGTKWRDITITLVADDMVEIVGPEISGRFTFHKLGMDDKRKGDKPKAMWALFKSFAENQGFISRKNFEYDRRLPDNARLLNKHLQSIFGIEGSIYTGHYKKEKGYRTKIKFRDRTH